MSLVDDTGTAHLRWYDPTVPGMVTTALAAGTLYPQLTLDDARQFNIGASDVVLSYVRDNILRYRIQRERFGTEHTPPVGDGGAPLSVPNKPLLHVSMNAGSRVQWKFLNTDNWAMNPAHALYYVRTHPEIGREPIANMNDASYRAAADKLFDEGFGICTSYESKAESVEEFEQRICRLIGGSVSRSLVDGQYYLDLARGDYDLDSLPVITDDDILSFEAQPATLDGAVNSVSVKYFDPCRKESVMTPAVQALGLIDAFGVIHQSMDYPEIPSGVLALIIATRDVRTSATPKIAFDLVCMPDAVRALRPNMYFRLQTPKYGVADMVCLLGDKQAGTLKSGAMRVKVTQDIYRLPQTSFIGIEPGVDTRPDPTPYPATAQAAMEAPYVELAQSLDRANLDVLPADVGYLLAVAHQPSQGGLNYSLAVSAGGAAFEVSATADWCPSAIVAGVPGSDWIGAQETVVHIGVFMREAQITLGSAALWDAEIVRIDAINLAASTITLGRGCADTVPVAHAAGSRIWAYDDFAGSDMVEYSDGDSLEIKLLTNTGTAQLDLAAAVPMTVDFVGRAARPYPPAAVLINGLASPVAIEATADVAWAHRDRRAQVDQLVDQTLPSIGPEPGTTYTVRWYLDDVLVNTTPGITGTSASYVPAAAGQVRIEVESERDGITSLQAFKHTAAYTPAPPP
ncbi:MAG: phage tail protein [Stenotrophomonas sp.]|uniref:phage tail protein n=1 Tax=Stenotrophomonas sp. TaxID=69392 RepID=UPI003D6D2BD2